jgi:AcrR family transcriptional regulator
MSSLSHPSERSPNQPALDPIAPLDPQQWVASVLKCEANAPIGDLRTALLRELDAKEFAPADTIWDAARILATDSSIGISTGQFYLYERSQEQLLELAIEQFARSFFQFPPAQRNARFRELAKRAQNHPRSTFRLRQLQAGLNVATTVAASESKMVHELAAYSSDLFVLRPSDRANRRHEVIASIRLRFSGAEKAARRLQKRYPSIAALAPDLIPPLAAHSKLTRAAYRKPKKRAQVKVKRRANFGVGALVSIGMMIFGAAVQMSKDHSSSSPNYNFYPPSRIESFAPPRTERSTPIPAFPAPYQSESTPVVSQSQNSISAINLSNITVGQTTQKPPNANLYKPLSISDRLSPFGVTPVARPQAAANPKLEPPDDNLFTQKKPSEAHQTPRTNSSQDVQFAPLPPDFQPPDNLFEQKPRR